MTKIEAAIAKLQSTNDWEGSPGEEWTDTDSATLQQKTGLILPPDLEWVLRRHGSNGFNEGSQDNFVAVDESGGITRHETQVLMTDREDMVSTTVQFAIEDGPDSRVPPPLLFFGTADGGHTHLLMNGKDHSDRAVYVWERSDDPGARALTRAAWPRQATIWHRS